MSDLHLPMWIEERGVFGVQHPCNHSETAKPAGSSYSLG